MKLIHDSFDTEHEISQLKHFISKLSPGDELDAAAVVVVRFY